ncbi:chromosomal cassette SCCmec type IV protein [Candidatus Termititenax aidoneus]|uniref:Chromosomal cassette SCCmec type IV protein n=1 Tax=Termititenax aidoneus TaxID=2218524 RepID=A0A388T9N2_TERA1|nr:chromosomal cassette SCCmec type IV protein [Candidatus Termititenax aidoneus]
MSMLTKITDYTHKSFKKFTNPPDLEFRQKNIVFGYNGKGKSAFALGVKAEFLKDASKTDAHFRLFNKEYIGKDLMLENSNGKLKGVKANFSEKDVTAETRIKELESEIVKPEDIKKQEEEILKIRKDARKEVDSIHDRKKGKARIAKKEQSKPVEDIIKLYESDYTEAYKIETDDEKLLKTTGDDSISKEIEKFESLQNLTFTTYSETEINELKAIFEEKFGEDVEIPANEIVNWMSQGLTLHKDGDSCKMCGGKLDYQSVKTKIEQYKDNRKHQAIEKLKSFQTKLKKSSDEIESIAKQEKTYSAIIGESVKESFQNIIGSKTSFEELDKSLQAKIEDILSSNSFDFDKLKSVSESIKTEIERTQREKSQQLTTLRNKQSNLETLVKGSIGLEVKNSQTIKDKLAEIKKKEDDLKKAKDKNTETQGEIQKLKTSKSPTKDFAEFVSQILQDINISLKVEVEATDNNYIIKSSHEEVLLTISDISEGEKNLLALLFFYYELFNDNKQTEVKTDIELVIVDDPISSMDDANKFYILELMKNILNLESQQVFVLTHSWDDFCNLSYGRKTGEATSKFSTIEIRKNNGKSYLEKVGNIEKPYKHLFKELYDFSQKSEKDIGTDCEIYHFPNVMRRVFEEWYSFKIGKDLNLTSNQLDRLANDFAITDTNKKTKLGMLLKVCNILSHSINTTKNPQEIHQSSKFLMKLIEDNDRLHFNSMKG